jgi:hypothetical protein
MCTNIDEKIIEMVRSHIELYDLSHPKYMDSAHKDEIWSSIGNEINLTGKWYLFVLHYVFFNIDIIFSLNNC